MTPSPFLNKSLSAHIPVVLNTTPPSSVSSVCSRFFDASIPSAKPKVDFKRKREKKELDVPPTVLKACSVLDVEIFEAQFKDWHAMVQRQRELSTGEDGPLFAELSEEIRIAEIEVSIAIAAQPALEMVRQRLDMLEKDRMKRFQVLKDIAGEVCLREMYMNLVLAPPAKDAVLELPEISSLGVFGLQLQIAGVPLPLG